MKHGSSSRFRSVSHRYYSDPRIATTILAQSVRDMSNHDPSETVALEDPCFRMLITRHNPTKTV